MYLLENHSVYLFMSIITDFSLKNLHYYTLHIVFFSFSFLHSSYINFKSLNQIKPNRYEWTKIVHVPYHQPCMYRDAYRIAIKCIVTLVSYHVVIENQGVEDLCDSLHQLQDLWGGAGRVRNISDHQQASPPYHLQNIPSSINHICHKPLLKQEKKKT